ncbi:hypothetical protein TWF281_000434 [Arthrobotrys megalospora]
MVTTEICVFNLLDTITLQDLLAADGVHQSSLSTVRSQPGCQTIYWGIGIQESQKLFWFIEWDSLSSHQTFQSLPTYPPFVSKALSIANPTHPSGPISVLHYNLPTPLSLLSPKSSPKPLLEYFALPLNTSLPDYQSSLSTVLDILSSGLKNYHDGPIEATYAFAIDEGHENESLSLICWRDKDQHAAFLETDTFKNAAPKMQELAMGPPLVSHIDFQEWE